MTTRPDVVATLLANDPARSFSHADGTGFSVDEVDLVFNATPEERVEAAEAVLAARSQAAQAIRGLILSNLHAAGITPSAPRDSRTPSR